MNTPQAQLNAALHRAAFTTPTGRAFLRVTGPDATRWLNGMVTNSAQALAPGEGSYNFLLNSQGRIQGDGHLYREHTAGEPAFLFSTDAGQIAAIQAHLDKFIIMDDVELSPAYEDESSLLLLGPEAPRLLASLGLPLSDPFRLTYAGTPHGRVLLLTARPNVGFELRAPAATLHALGQQLEAQNIQELEPDILEQLRILIGVPKYGTDIRDRELPQETGQTHALHFSKGCYLGQEIVERIHSRGQVNRIFTALRLQGSVPALPAPLEALGKVVGEITSAARVDLITGTETVALGYVRRDALTAPVQRLSTSTAATADSPEQPHGPVAGLLQYPGGTALARAIH